MDELTISTGADNINELGIVEEHNGKHKLDIWGTDECNNVGGAVGIIFPPFISKNKPLDIYFKELCRKFPVTYRREVSAQGITGYRFTPSESAFGDVDHYPENSCYCPDGPPCMPSGLFNASACAFGTLYLLFFLKGFISVSIFVICREHTLRTILRELNMDDTFYHCLN